ncbi:MAG TPA: signal recognition particle receptor subunit alpha, partial [Acidimicrobiales bacterium]
MEIVVAVVLVAVLVVVATAAFVAVNRQRRGIPLEPPPTTDRSHGDAASSTAVLEPPVVEEPPVDLDTTTVEDVVVEEPVVVEPVVEEPVEAPPAKVSFRERLGKARGLLAGYFGAVRSRSGIDQETWDELEEALIRADVGVATTTALLDQLRERVRAEGIKDPDA